jgi:hypothetical protein
MAKPREQIHDQMLANLRERVKTERGRLRRTLSGDEPDQPEAPTAESPQIDLAPRVRARRRGTGRLYQVFQAWAEEPPPEA